MLYICRMRKTDDEILDFLITLEYIDNKGCSEGEGIEYEVTQDTIYICYSWFTPEEGSYQTFEVPLSGDLKVRFEENGSSVYGDYTNTDELVFESLYEFSDYLVRYINIYLD